MKRIVLCFDGTWNKPADENLDADKQVETNVSRLFRSVSPQSSDGTEQRKWYDEGVGSHWYDRFGGALIGAGLELNIVQGYRFLSESYEEGDEIYVFGFSRGAYTARSLVGMLRNIGLVKKGHLSELRIATAYGLYRARDDGPDSRTARFFKSAFTREVPVKFLGVWDTVGALGIPLSLVNDFNLHFYEFHDTTLSAIVENGYHAIALDEHRDKYDVCLWNPPARLTQKFEQRWFVGAHCDVGGGYPDRGLSDIPLRWMQDRAASVGLATESRPLPADGFRSPFRDSYAEFLGGKFAKVHPRHFRNVLSTHFGNEVLDETIRKRREGDPTYRPQNSGL